MSMGSGSDKEGLFPKTIVGYNASGGATINGGGLKVANGGPSGNLADAKDAKHKIPANAHSNANSNGRKKRAAKQFNMERGRLEF